MQKWWARSWRRNNWPCWRRRTLKICSFENVFGNTKHGLCSKTYLSSRSINFYCSKAGWPKKMSLRVGLKLLAGSLLSRLLAPWNPMKTTRSNVGCLTMAWCQLSKIPPICPCPWMMMGQRGDCWEICRNVESIQCTSLCVAMSVDKS